MQGKQWFTHVYTVSYGVFRATCQPLLHCSRQHRSVAIENVISHSLKQLQALLADSLTLELIDVVSFVCCSPRAVGVKTLGENTNEKAEHGDANSSSSSHIVRPKKIQRRVTSPVFWMMCSEQWQ
jgi:hypothetical protein